MEDIGGVLEKDEVGEELKELQAAQRRALPSWEEVKDDPPSARATLSEFPPAEMALLRESGLGRPSDRKDLPGASGGGCSV